jgi:undecaprenyl-diphosphatase
MPEVRAAAPGLVPVSLLLAVLGSRLVVLPLVLAVGALLWVRGERCWAGWLVACGVGGWLLTEALKATVRRTRPPDPLLDAVGWAFPSGHTTAGICSWLALGVVAVAVLRRPWNRWLGGAAMIVGVLLGPSRWVLGVHWFTDVLAGWLLAAAWVLAVSAAASALHPAGGRPGH